MQLSKLNPSLRVTQLKKNKHQNNYNKSQWHHLFQPKKKMIQVRSRSKVWLTSNILPYLWSFLTNHLWSLMDSIYNTFPLRLTKIKRDDSFHVVLKCDQQSLAVNRHVDVVQQHLEIKHWPPVSSTSATLRHQVLGLRPTVANKRKQLAEQNEMINSWTC